MLFIHIIIVLLLINDRFVLFNKLIIILFMFPI